MGKKGFDLAALAREALGENVSNLDTQAVQKIPAENIAANAANFYEMQDLEELAASIELTGLLHPILVRPGDEHERYVILDGERRFRAMTEVLGWTEVPALVRVPVNAVLEELMLIEANRTARKISTADLSRQAERYTVLLAQLRDSGVEIPGRLRDRVAEALDVSASKLGRLSAIRKRLEPGLLSMFDDGELSESAAYELSKFDHQKQLRVFDFLTPANPEGFPRSLTAEAIRVAGEDDDRWNEPEPATKAKQTTVQDEDDDFFQILSWAAESFLPTLADVYDRKEGIALLKSNFGSRYRGRGASEYAWDATPAGLTVESMDHKIRKIFRSWTVVYDLLCTIALNRVNQTRKDAPGESPEAPAKQDISLRFLGWLTCAPPAGVKCWARFMDEDTSEFTMLATWDGEAEAWYAGDRLSELSCIEETCLGWWPLPADDAPDLPADLTPHTTEKAVPDSDTPMASWGTGKPTEPGLYAVRFKVGENAPGEIHNFARWDGWCWTAERSRKPITDMVAAGWYPLPTMDAEEKST